MSSMLDSFSETAMSALSSVSIPSLSTELFSSALSQGQPNGLHNFIKDIRDVKSKEEERVRVDKELGNIRKKFAQSSSLTSYQKKKYVWKMCYIYMLGYEVDFGHMEFISLLSSTKFQEKSVGYMAVALFLKPGDELMTLVINSIRNDIVGRLNFGQTLALSAVSNVGGTDLAEALSADVQKFLTPISDLSQYSFGSNADVEMRNRTSVVKKAALCLLRLYRTNPDCLSVPDWVEKLSKLLEDRDLGIVTSVMSLILGLLAQPQNVQCLSALIPFVISVIVKLTILKTSAESYYYYKIASPWLQVKCLKFLQYYDFPEAQHRELLTDALVQILTKTEISESVNKTNADYSIIYEAVTLVINYGPDMDDRLRGPTFTFLGKFISTNEPNIRYIGLDLMNFVLKREDASSVRMYQRNVLESLKDTDISVRKRALENMFSLTDEDNVREIIDELLVVLTTTESGIKEDFVVKIAILTEKFYAGDLKWYIDIMVKMFLIAGDYIAEAIWHRIVLIVTNHPEVHEYAAEKLFECVKAKFIPDILIALAGYLLGEIGINICEKPDMSGYEQFAALHQHFQLSSLKTQSVLLTTYVKLMNLYPDTKDAILEVFQKHSTSMQLEIQQRACEYIKMPSIGAEIMEQVLNAMPPYSEEKENELLSLNTTKDTEGGEKTAWNVNSAATVTPATDGFKLKIPEDTNNSNPGKSTSKMMDLLSLEENASPKAQPSIRSASATPTSRSTITLNTDEESLVRSYLDASLLSLPNERSLLYENSVIKVAVSFEFRAYKGRLTYYFYNKSSKDITQFQTKVDTIPEVSVKYQPVATQISSGEEVTMLIAVECLKPFKQLVQLVITFASGNAQYVYRLDMPILLSSFFEPVPSDKATYMTRWKVLGNEVQEIFASGKTLTPEYLLYIRNVLFSKLKIGLASELDTSEKTSTGSFSFHTSSVNSEGNLVSVGGMLRLEGDPSQNRFRVTIRSKHPLVSEAIRDVLKRFLM